MAKRAMLRERLRRFWKTPRSIFWKIFLWFWLAGILIVAAVVVVMAAAEPQSLLGRWKILPITWLIDESTQCAEIYEAEGSEALDHYLAELSRHMTASETGGISFDGAYFFNPEGIALTNRHPTSDQTTLVRRAANRADIYVQISFGEYFVAKSVTRPGGKSYVFVVSKPHEIFFGR